jgi:hypothetical protein
MPRLRSLVGKVDKLTGGAPGAAYNLSVVPRLHLTGTLAGEPLSTDYSPSLSLQLDTLQLRPAAGSTAPGAGSPASDSAKLALNPSRGGTVAASTKAPNALSVRGLDLPVGTARWIALIGFLLAGAAALLSGLRPLGDPTADVHRYRHLIVPIAAPTYDPVRPPIDVTSIGALAQLAERSERLILHHQDEGVDTYLVDDEGTLYRYRAASNGLPRIPALSLVDDRVYETVGR